ncbi:hypothetical protein EAF04_006769 [Stromatinia cepivora]|nr:hypothetical protein EAF04_006769 [Stromatinia cepivora]
MTPLDSFTSVTCDIPSVHFKKNRFLNYSLPLVLAPPACSSTSSASPHFTPHPTNHGSIPSPLSPIVPAILSSPFGSQIKSFFSSNKTSDDEFWHCKGIEGTEMLLETENSPNKYHQASYVNTSISSTASTASSSSAIFTASFPQPTISPPTSSLTTPFIQPSSATTAFLLSSTPCKHINYNREGFENYDRGGFRITHIWPQSYVCIELGTLNCSMPTNYLMWHPIGHLVLLKTIVCTRGINWSDYFALLMHILKRSDGGIRRFHLEDLNDGQWKIKVERGMCPCAMYKGGSIEIIDRTWEVRALLAWEKNIFVFLGEMMCDIMKGFCSLFVYFVHWVTAG